MVRANLPGDDEDRSRGGSETWRPAPPHPRERERLAALRDSELIGSGAEPGFDRITSLAARVLEMPMALVNLVDRGGQFCKSAHGAAAGWKPREESLCSHTILRAEPLIVRDFAADPFFRDCPAFLQDGLRFYAGFPLVDDEGFPLGVLCVADLVPRDPSDEWIAEAAELAALARDQMALSRVNRRLERSLRDLERSEQRHETLVATVPGVVFRLIVHGDGVYRFTFVSDGVRDLFGFTPEEFIPFAAGGTILHPEDRDELTRRFQSSGRTSGSITWQGRIVRRDGRERWVQITARPEHWGGGQWSGGETTWSGIVTDIAPLKAAEEEIREINRSLETRVLERTSELAGAQIEMLARLGRAAEMRDDDTGAHIGRVARTCGILARGMGLSESECEMIRRASPMHDIGKISVPDAILLKPGALTHEERTVMQRHTIEGARLLEGGTTPLVRMAEEIARTHHERWDGAGYPHGLKGEEIPLAGRIVAIADVFDALTSERPYKRSWALEDAVEEIRRGAGTQFDPELIAVFERTLGEILGDAEEAIYLLSSGGAATEGLHLVDRVLGRHELEYSEGQSPASPSRAA